MSLIPEDELREVKARVTSKQFRCTNELFAWFVDQGPSLINEVLAYRAGTKSASSNVLASGGDVGSGRPQNAKVVDDRIRDLELEVEMLKTALCRHLGEEDSLSNYT